MILTGNEIKQMVLQKKIIIKPFHEKYLDPNSYSFHLGENIIEYNEMVIDSSKDNSYESSIISDSGKILKPDHFYLGHTYEELGGVEFASELYANCSTALCGIFIQTSAPLGHTGAVIRWTLEILVTQPVIIYPRMKIGKICFWNNFGQCTTYKGRYLHSNTVVPSRISMDTT